MSTPSSTPLHTPVESQAPSQTAPSTPPNLPATIRVTLPTPTSFGAHRRSHSINSPASVADSHSQRSRESPKRGHSRTVSFNQDVEIKTMISDKGQAGGNLYKIPQRQQDAGSAIDEISPRTRKGPPSALSLAPRALPGPLLASPFSGPKTAPVSSRFATTAAARGLSIAPALAKIKEKGKSTGSSIWSAGLTSTGGWITPGLASARSTASAAVGTARQRGLSVAVMKDGREMLVDSGPITPGLPSGRTKSLETGEGSPKPVAPDVKSPQPTSASRPKEVILCRYFHTPGLTCTSRPCRFVHNLSTLPASPSVDPAKLRMLSPTKSPDYTMGTFAQAQDDALNRVKTMEVRDDGIDVGEAQPGEVVVLSGEGGKEVVGTVFYMSGGGKGPAGKSRAKFKTVPCRDFDAGYCPYGESCSFIHDDKTSPRASELAEKAAKTPNVDVADSGRDSRHDASTRTVPELNVKKTPVSAWARGPPRFGKPLRSADGLSAFAAPYSSKPLAVDPKGEVVDASLVPPPPVIVSAAKAQSVWNRGPPHCAPKTPASKPRVHHITIVPADEVDAGAQEVEMPIPTPSHAHLMPPISAWTVNSTDSDPAAPWDPAILARGPRPDTETDVGMAYVPTYPWGVPMHPAVPSYPDQHGLMYLPKDHDVLWTPKGWAVQDAGMKRAMSFAEMNSGKPHRNRRAGKNYYRKRPCKFYAQGDCPHGDRCTYLHVLPTAHPDPTLLASDKTRQNVTPTLPCKFYNSQAGCENGETCSFLHTSVIPDAATPVIRPRPWRTRPCRHFQLARCNLGDACYFAHVVDPNFVLPKGYEPTANTTGQLCRTGVCALGDKCRFVHYRDPTTSAHEEQVEDHSQTEGKLEELKRMVKNVDLRAESDDDDDEEDDVQIVTSGVTST